MCIRDSTRGGDNAHGEASVWTLTDACVEATLIAKIAYEHFANARGEATLAVNLDTRDFDNRHGEATLTMKLAVKLLST